ncbi:MAG TPA: hypothetical protein VLA24_09195 [Pseudomonadales bacterium]|nr:hypothetical protein [Pseudomonadales bacterium]
MSVGGNIDTEGGGVVGGDARVGRDYTGRDQSPINVYNNQFGDDRHQAPTRPQVHESAQNRLRDLERYIYGDGITPGLLRQQIDILKQLSELRKQIQTMLFWIYFLTAVMAVLVILGILNLIVLRIPL